MSKFHYFHYCDEPCAQTRETISEVRKKCPSDGLFSQFGPKKRPSPGEKNLPHFYWLICLRIGRLNFMDLRTAPFRRTFKRHSFLGKPWARPWPMITRDHVQKDASATDFLYINEFIRDYVYVSRRPSQLEGGKLEYMNSKARIT